jgi:hypothetical protein
MGGLKTFFTNFKKSLDGFADSQRKCLEKYQKDICTEPAYDTLTASLDNI